MQLYLEDFSNPFNDSFIGNCLGHPQKRRNQLLGIEDLDQSTGQFATDHMIKQFGHTSVIAHANMVDHVKNNNEPFSG